MESPVITLVGGSGFVGRFVAKHLAKAGYRLKIVCRRPELAQELKTAGDLGQVVLVKGDLARPETIAPHLKGSFAVINLVGILFQSGTQQFSALHHQGAGALARAAKQAGAEVFIHMSALGCDRADDSRYAQTKLKGEAAVRQSFPEATLLRPSVLFGPEDNFFNQFARLAVFSPVLPLIGGGKTKFQPVYVGDVARAILEIIERPELRGQTYELGGPQMMTFKEILQFVLHVTGRKRMLMPVPFPLASAKGLACELLPFSPMITRDQVRLLHHDNIESGSLPGFKKLGITPLAVDVVVPTYLKAFRDTAQDIAA